MLLSIFFSLIHSPFPHPGPTTLIVAPLSLHSTISSGQARAKQPRTHFSYCLSCLYFPFLLNYRMKIFGFCVVLGLVGVVFMPPNSFTGVVNRSIIVSGKTVVDGVTMTTTETSRNLKGNRYGTNLDQGSHDGDVNLEDYRPIDPSPSSKASIKHGPVEHGTPFHPYIPKPRPSPPSPSPSDD